jgi:hypothetical protein
VSGGQVNANTAFSSGGGIFALAGNVNLTDGAQVMTNSSWGNGGGIYDHATTHTQGVDITDATVAGNVAEFHGGGVFVSTGTITVLDSAIYGNFADRRTGGGLDDNDAAGGVSVTNSTVGGNFTKINGAGIDSAGTATINNSTIVSNALFIDGKGAGIHATGTIGIDNTIVAGNFDEPTVTQHDISGRATGSNNVIGNAGSAGGLVNGHNSNIVGLNGTGTRPLNAIINTTLANNGGATDTYSLAFGSVALGTGNSALNPSSVGNYDQRGPGFPRTVNGSMDIGAIENAPLGATVAQGASVRIFDQDGVLMSPLTPFGTSVAVTVAVGDVTGDGIPDIVVAAGNAVGLIDIYDGKTDRLIHTYAPYGAAYTGGLNIALGDIVPGQADIIVAPTVAKKPVEVLNAANGAVVTSFTPFPSVIAGANYTNGVRVAAGDLNGNASGQDEIIVGTANPQAAYAEVWTYNGSGMVQTGQHFSFAGNGVFLASGTFTPGGNADIIVGTGVQTGSIAAANLYVIDGISGNVVASLPASPLGVFSNAALNTTVRVAVRDVNGDGIPDIEVATGPGATQQVRIFDLTGTSLVLENIFTASELGLPSSYNSGLFVG